MIQSIKGRTRILFIISLFIPFALTLSSCGTEEDDDDTATATTLAFSDVSTIIENSCGGSDCHSSGAPNNVYVGNESLVNSNASSLTTRIESTNSSLVMPPTDSGKTLSSADKATLLNYLSQQ